MANEINWSALKMTKEGTVPPLIWNRLIDIIHSICITSVSGGLTMNRVFGAGTALKSVTAASGIPATVEPPPFFVTVIANGDGTYKAWVNLESDFLLGHQPTAKQTITGLGESAAFNCNGNDLIWLEASFDPTSGALTGATIQSYGMGDLWDVAATTTPAVGVHSWEEFTTTTDGSGNTIYHQTLSRIAICQMIAGPSGAPVPRQLLTQNVLLVTEINELGAPVGYMEPYGSRSYKL
jgi:hypothetical protein